MAERKFIRIPAKDLPDLFYVPDDENAPEDGGKNVYFARYRIASEDGVLASAWSPKFEVSAEIAGSAIRLDENTEWKVSKNSDVLNVTWNPNSLFSEKKLFINKFHVYVRFHTNNETSAKWQFVQETTATNFSTIIPSNKKADVAVLIPTYRGLDATSESPASPIDLFPESWLFYKLNV
jgi:hypothetical protein